MSNFNNIARTNPSLHEVKGLKEKKSTFEKVRMKCRRVCRIQVGLESKWCKTSGLSLTYFCLSINVCSEKKEKYREPASNWILKWICKYCSKFNFRHCGYLLFTFSCSICSPTSLKSSFSALVIILSSSGEFSIVKHTTTNHSNDMVPCVWSQKKIEIKWRHQWKSVLSITFHYVPVM